MKNKIAEQARLMSLRASIDDDVSDMLLECSKEIERLDGIKPEMFFSTSVDFPTIETSVCDRCDKPLNQNGHCDSVKCLGLPVQKKKYISDYVHEAAKNMVDDMGVLGMMCFGHKPDKDETFEQARVRIFGGWDETMKKDRMMPPIELLLPTQVMLRAIDVAQDISLVEEYAKANHGLVIAPGESDDEFKERVKRKLITGSERSPEDMLCSDCYRPTNSEGHCINFACPGKGGEND